MEDSGTKWGGKNLPALDYTDGLSILDESVSKINDLLEALWVRDSRIDLIINVKKTKSLRQGIKEDKKLWGTKRLTYLMYSFTYLGSINSKDGGTTVDVKNRIAEAQVFFYN